MRQHVVEGMGAFFLMMALMVNPLALGLVLMAMIYIGGHISGGHYNPAFSLAAWLHGWLPAPRMATYMIAQTAGALLMVFYSYYISGQMVRLSEIPLEQTAFKMMVPEILLTFVFVSLFLAASSVSTLREAGLNGLAIGLALTGLGNMLGGGLNPALSGAVIIGNICVGSWPTMAALLVQVASPLIGGALAVALFKYLNRA
jgi:aquaporin Z